MFDWDGVMNLQVPYLCGRLGIPVPNRYRAEEATNITAEEAAALNAAYRSVNGYLGVPLATGLRQVLSLPCVPYIYSGNVSTGMLEYKRQAIKCVNPQFPDSHIILVNSMEKPPLSDVDVMVEDGPHYLSQYPCSTVKILVDFPYNQDAPSDMIRVSDLWGALDIIDRLIN